MNKAILVGNLTRDPELRTIPSGAAVTTFTIAVNRRYKAQDGTQPTDFINCVAWRSTAEFISKYFTKGSKIGVVGSIQTRNYDDANGVRRYVTEVVVDDAEFVTSKAQNQNAGGRDDYPEPPPQQPQQQGSPNQQFAQDLGDFQALDDAELPF